MGKEKMDERLEMQLLAYFNGELTDAECRELEAWINACPENRKAYTDLMKDYQKIAWAAKEKEIRLEESRRELFRKIHRPRLRARLLGAAAAVALLLTCGSLILLRPREGQRRDGETEFLAQNTARARLVMSTGEVVELNDTRKIIQGENGELLQVSCQHGEITDTIRPGRSEDRDAYNRIIVPKGGEFFITLGDGSNIWLNADTELEYPTAFADSCREVRLRGEAFFKVRQERNRPFRVHSGNYNLQVYGTEFNLNTYHPENIQAALVRGSVGFRAKAGSEERLLSPNQLGTADSRTGETSVRDVDIYPYIAWKNDEIVFVNEDLESIMEKVARWYDVEVFFQNEGLKKECFYANMKRYDEPGRLLSFMEKTSNVRFSLNGKTITISYK